MTLNPNENRILWLARTALLLLSLILIALFFWWWIFPAFRFTFDFTTPESTKNTLMTPMKQDGTSLATGRVDTAAPMTIHGSTTGDIDTATVSITLRDNSLHPQSLGLSLSRGYLATTSAAGRTTPADALGTEPQTLTNPRLVSFADGVYRIDEGARTIRPFGSPEVFLGYGYSFDNVVPVDGGEVGRYTMGRILLLGESHPVGTVFRDATDRQYKLTTNGMRKLAEAQYVSPQDAIFFTPESASVNCALQPTWYSSRTYTCKLDAKDLQKSIGPDYSITLNSPEDTKVESMDLELSTTLSGNTFDTTVGKIKERLLSRFNR
jgi:hypothetical protein